MIRFLLDTNIPSELIRAAPSPSVTTWIHAHTRGEYAVSVITLAEVAKGIAQQRDPVQAARLQLWLDTKLRRWFTEARTFGVSASIAERAGRLMGEQQKNGRHVALADALIASTAMEHDLILVARNTRDFEPLGLRMIDPWLSSSE